MQPATNTTCARWTGVTVESFERFMREVTTGSLRRNAFQNWEIELLIDIQQVRVERGRSEQLMRRYRQAARKFIERSHGQLLTMSDYLSGRHRTPGWNRQAIGSGEATSSPFEGNRPAA
jgi:hypothetical protein